MTSTELARDEQAGYAEMPDCVRTLPENALLMGISLATLRRMIAAGAGPKITRLSERRIGIRDSHRTEWLDGRASNGQGAA